MENNEVRTDVLLTFEQTADHNTQVEILTVPAGGTIGCCGYPEERLYLAESGYGVISVYDSVEEGDVYVLRANVTAYFTPGLRHEIVNAGDIPLRLAVFRVRGGLVPDGAEEGVQKWTSIGRSKAVGTGFWYTDVFNLTENETAREGQFLQVWGVGMRRPQKMAAGEVLLLGAGRATRKHAHSETHELFYILMGQGNFEIGDRVIPFSAGAVCDVPVGEVHLVRNTGKTPLLYICVTRYPAEVN